MATLIVPRIEKDEHKIYATLGDQVAEWLEANAVWGPGSKFGQPLTIDDEFYGFLVRAYQIFPHSHDRAGRRRFDLCSEEKAKGVGKTEHALNVGQAEFHPSAPVRCVDWVHRGRAWIPVGGPVPYPRLIFSAATEDQVQRTAFGRFREALRKSPHASDYHITLDRIVLLGPDGAPAGEAFPVAVSPDTADGELPTWQHIDEPHRWDMPRHHEMFDTIGENAVKDVDSDAWTMTSSTAGHTGGRSIEERLLHTAEAIERGEVRQPNFFFIRRFCPDDWPLDTEVAVEAAVREARGIAADWSGDIPRIVARYFDPKTNPEYWERVWLNRWVKGAGMAFDPKLWATLHREGEIPRGEMVTLGFDGARRRDSTGLVATGVRSGFQQVVGLWEKPFNIEDWEVPPLEVDEAMVEAFNRWNVWRAYLDPPYWDDWVPVWEGRWGTDRVHRWWTNRRKVMAFSLRGYLAAQQSGELTFGGPNKEWNEAYRRHIANAYKDQLPMRDEEDVELWVIKKARPDSPDKIDLAMAGCLSWQARMDAVTKGVLNQETFVPRRIR